jgi:hypothetical protein
MCSVWILEQTVNLPYMASTDWFFITEVETVHCAVYTESLYKRDYISSLEGYIYL